LSVTIQSQAFDSSAEIARLSELGGGVGAVATFIGQVRSEPDAPEPVLALELEHYPGMTERAIEAILADAGRRWSLLGVRVIHRIGRLETGEPIVLVGTASSHRGDALAACEFIMDYLKTRAPLWKKEITAAGEHWVEARARDRRAAERWSRGSEGSQGHV